MSEAPPRRVLAAVPPNRVAKASSSRRGALPKSSSRQPVQHSPRMLANRATLFMDDSDQNDTQTSLPRSDTSNISNLSLLSGDTPTDDLGRRILEHARWTKHAALESGALQMRPFSKARPAPPLAAAMNDFQPRDKQALHGETQATHEPADARPTSPNVPRQWGTKGRQRNDFLRRLTASANGPEQREGGGSLRQTAGPTATAQKNVLAAEDIPRPSIENPSPPRATTGGRRNIGYRRRGQTQNVAPPSEANGDEDPGETAEQRDDVQRPQTFSYVGGQQANEEADLRSQIPRRPGSRDLLKQLARAGSSTPSPSPGREETQLPTPPQDNIRRRNLQPKSPVVTGGWISTPLSQARERNENRPTGFRTSQFAASRPNILQQEAANGQAQPRSALESILRSGDDDLANDPLGESTIASLKDLVAQDEAGELSTVLQLDKDTINLVNNVTVPVRHGQELRAEEKEALRRMGDALRSARTGLRDASLGIKRVEHQFEQVEKRQAQVRPGGVCEHCGCSGTVTLSGLLARACKYFLSFFYSWPNNGRLRLTWLGLVTLIVVTWLTTEFSLCEFYCHPLYADSMVGYGVDIRSPRMPYVTTTILFKRPFGWIIEPVWRLLGWIVRSIVQSLVSGLTDGHDSTGRSGGGRGTNSATAAAFRAASRAGFRPDVGFGHDEVI